MVKIYSAATLPDAHIVLGALAQAGIDGRVLNENAQSIMGEIPFHHAWPEVWIMNVKDTELAREIIDQIEGRKFRFDRVFCPHCHEENPAHFHTCWSCSQEF